MPLQNVHFIEADIKEKKIMEEPRVVANDDVAFIVSITDNGNSIDTSLVTQTVLASVRPDRKTVITPGVLLEDGTVKFELGHTETQKSGQVKATAQLFDSEGDRISSVAFSYHVERDPTGEDYIPTKKDKTFIEIVLVEGPEVIQQAKDVTAAAQQATSNADTATGRADKAAAGAESVIDEFSGFKDSVAKAKSFGTVDARFEDLEKDSFFPVKNILPRDGFTDNSGWVAANSTLTADGDGWIVTGNGNTTYPNVYAGSRITGEKYYSRALVTVLDEVPRLIFNVVALRNKTINNPLVNQEFSISGVETSQTTSSIASIQIGLDFNSAVEGLGKRFKVRKQLSLNLTKMFGSGNEPTAEEMDALLAFYPESWFDGTVNLAENKKLVTFLLNQLRAKASKKQEAWITPTLVNGWTHHETRPVQYRKNEFGVVEIRGSAIGGSSGQVVFSLPSGYRPYDAVYMNSVYGTTNTFGILINAAGSVVFTTQSPSATHSLENLRLITG